MVPEAGRTYERHAIEEFWRQSGRPVDPMSNCTLQRREVYTNWDKRGEVQSFLEQFPEYLPEGWEDRAVPTAENVEESRSNEKIPGSQVLPSAITIWSSTIFRWLRCLRRLVVMLVVTVLMCEAMLLLWAHRRLL